MIKGSYRKTAIPPKLCKISKIDQDKIKIKYISSIEFIYFSKKFFMLIYIKKKYKQEFGLVGFLMHDDWRPLLRSGSVASRDSRGIGSATAGQMFALQIFVSGVVVLRY